MLDLPAAQTLCVKPCIYLQKTHEKKMIMKIWNQRVLLWQIVQRKRKLKVKTLQADSDSTNQIMLSEVFVSLTISLEVLANSCNTKI